MFGVISDGPHTVLPQDVRPGLPDVQAIENQVGFPRYRQYFAEGNDTSSHYANESTSKYYRFRKQKREEESGGKNLFSWFRLKIFGRSDFLGRVEIDFRGVEVNKVCS